MVKTVATALIALTALVPTNGQKRKVCPPIAADDTVIVKVLPRNYDGEGERFKHGERDYGRHETREHNDDGRESEHRARKNREPRERGIQPQLYESRLKSADGDYIIDEDMSYGGSSADDRYAALKAALDEKFAYMFELKQSLDRVQSAMSEKWSEYYALQEKYNRELKKIIGAWATESSYDDYDYRK